MAIGEKIPIVEIMFQTITFRYNLATEIVPLVDQLTPMGFIPSSASIGTQTTLESQVFQLCLHSFLLKMCIHITYCFIVIYGIDLMFLYNGLKRLFQIHELVSLYDKFPTMIRHQCTRMGMLVLDPQFFMLLWEYDLVISNRPHSLSYYSTYSHFPNIQNLY